MKDSKDQDILSEISASPSPQHPGVTTHLDLDDNEKREQETLEKDDFISLVFNNKTVSEKYKRDLIKQAEKDPRSVQVKTPEGWMTVKEAIEAGYDPDTGEFSKPGIPPINAEKALEGMPQQDAEKLKGMMDPKNMSIPPEQMQERGIKEGMFGQFGKAKPQQVQTPTEGGVPEEGIVPTEEEGAPAVPDLASILGGGGVNG